MIRTVCPSRTPYSMPPTSIPPRESFWKPSATSCRISSITTSEYSMVTGLGAALQVPNVASLMLMPIPPQS